MAQINVGTGPTADVLLINREKQDVRFLGGPVTDNILVNDIANEHGRDAGGAVVVFRYSNSTERRNFLNRLVTPR